MSETCYIAFLKDFFLLVSSVSTAGNLVQTRQWGPLSFSIHPTRALPILHDTNSRVFTITDIPNTYLIKYFF